jgi:L,D-transpeptidase YbiS
MRIEISIKYQKLIFSHRNVRLKYSISTSRFGEGFEEGSKRTPLGMHVVCEKIGEGAEPGTVFKDRMPTGEVIEIGSGGGESDKITSRILRLEGVQIKNRSTYERHIYIHGTNDENSIGQKASHGCIRMKNYDIIELFDHVQTGCKVRISKN